MKTRKIYTSILAAVLALAALPAAVSAQSAADLKNVAQVEYRTLPADFENLPARETGKWNFGFRPYDAESAAYLWSDPNVIRNVAAGGDVDAKHLITGLYVTCDPHGMTILGYAALKDHNAALDKGSNLENVFFECFFIPGDADNPMIINYQPFGVCSNLPNFRYKLSWMKPDRNNREMFDDLRVDARVIKNGAVVRIFVPWVIIWDHLPVFANKKDNFWRLSMIRWGGSHGGETWGGRVHSQTKCGYIRMPDFTAAQQAEIMRTTLYALWNKYQVSRNAIELSPTQTVSLDYYRKSIDHLPHSWMNVNEDPVFRMDTLFPLVKDRDAIGKELAKFDSMTTEQQKAFYKKIAPLLANYHYDVDDLYADHLKKQMMKR